MNAEQKKRIAHEINNWNNAAKTILCTDIGARMANILQELVDAPEPEPVAWMVKNGFVCSMIYQSKKDADNYAADQQKRHDLSGSLASFCVIPLYTSPHEPKPVARVTGYYAGYLSIATVDGRVLPAGTALYTAPPHQSEHHLEMVNTPAPSVPVEPDDAMVWKAEEDSPEFHHGDPWYGAEPPSEGQIRAIYTAMLETAPPPPKLSDERIWELIGEYKALSGASGKEARLVNLARAIEREILGDGHE